MTMSFRAAEQYLLGTINETVSRRMPYRLERMRALVRELGDPHLAYPTIHVGGTSGKSSTSTMIASSLQAAGKRVGLHTKPHLISVTERARINGVSISEDRFAEILDSMMPAIDRVTLEHGRPTYYETLLALAFAYFAEERVDVAAVEVGLGGSLDGTNVVVPEVTTITSIGFDHVEVLGDTLEAIASEKAGIAKPGVPMVVSVDDERALAAISERAKAVNAPLFQVALEARVEPESVGRSGQAFTVTTSQHAYALRTPMLGEFQRRNAATAIVTLERLSDELRPDVDAIERGFAHLSIAGRMELFVGHPTIVFDIAHNAEKAEHLVRSLRERFPDRRFTFVAAVSEGKDATEILRALGSVPANFILTSFDNTPGRTAMRPQRLASIVDSLGFWGRAIADPVDALAIARRTAAADDVVVVTGSTFIVTALRTWWFENVADTSALHA